MGLIYKPFGIILGIIGGLVGRKLFDFVWTKIDDEEPPGALTEETTWAPARRRRRPGHDLQASRASSSIATARSAAAT